MLARDILQWQLNGERGPIPGTDILHSWHVAGLLESAGLISGRFTGGGLGLQFRVTENGIKALSDTNAYLIPAICYATQICLQGS